MCTAHAAYAMLSYSFSFAVYSGSRKTKHACRQQCNPQCHMAVISGLGRIRIVLCCMLGECRTADVANMVFGFGICMLDLKGNGLACGNLKAAGWLCVGKQKCPMFRPGFPAQKPGS